MSEELTVETKNFITKKLRDAQEATGHGRAWCKREPKKWALVAQHIIQKPDEVSTFLRKNKITTQLLLRCADGANGRPRVVRDTKRMGI